MRNWEYKLYSRQYWHNSFCPVPTSLHWRNLSTAEREHSRTRTSICCFCLLLSIITSRLQVYQCEVDCQLDLKPHLIKGIFGLLKFDCALSSNSLLEGGVQCGVWCVGARRLKWRPGNGIWVGVSPRSFPPVQRLVKFWNSSWTGVALRSPPRPRYSEEILTLCWVWAP